MLKSSRCAAKKGPTEEDKKKKPTETNRIKHSTEPVINLAKTLYTAKKLL